MAKAELVGAERPRGARCVTPNDDGGIRALVERRRALPPAPIVLEATGGHELARRRDGQDEDAVAST